MSTLAFQSQLQRRRFTQHAFAGLSARLPAFLRSWVSSSAAGPARPTAEELVARQAQDVRELARSYERTEPGFAADLYAAAARHEEAGVV